MSKKKEQPTQPAQRPTQLRILGRTYRVYYIPTSPLNNAFMGSCGCNNQQILVEQDQTPIEEADTVLHEAMHGICTMMRLGLDAATEEKVVSALSTALLGVLQDNPEFARWLIEPRG